MVGDFFLIDHYDTACHGFAVINVACIRCIGICNRREISAIRAEYAISRLIDPLRYHRRCLTVCICAAVGSVLYWDSLWGTKVMSTIWIPPSSWMWSFVPMIVGVLTGLQSADPIQQTAISVEN
jgi:hypothetical protein